MKLGHNPTYTITYEEAPTVYLARRGSSVQYSLGRLPSFPVSLSFSLLLQTTTSSKGFFPDPRGLLWTPFINVAWLARNPQRPPSVPRGQVCGRGDGGMGALNYR